MPIPVTIPVGALPIAETDNTEAEILLQEIAQVMNYGTTGASVDTPATMVPNPADPKSLIALALNDATKQLFLRQVAIVFGKALNSVGFNPAQQDLTASIDGSTVVFPLAHTPRTGTLLVFLNGVLLRPGVDYTITGGNTINLTTAPTVGEWLYASYIY